MIGEMQALDNLKDMCNDSNLTQLVTKPTRPNPKEPSKSTLIDLILSDTVEKYVSTGVLPNILVTIAQLFVLEM
jgi:hypothetical protein